MQADGPSVIRRTKSVAVFESRYGTLYNDEVTADGLSSGTYLRWDWASRGVVIVPESPDGLFLVPAYRYPVGQVSLELPRGGADPGEGLEVAARRELREEAGLLSGEISPIGTIYAETGLISAPITVFRATNSVPGPRETDSLEEIGQGAWVSAEAIWGLIAGGELRCGISIAAFSLWHVAKRSQQGSDGAS